MIVESKGCFVERQSSQLFDDHTRRNLPTKMTDSFLPQQSVNANPNAPSSLSEGDDVVVSSSPTDSRAIPLDTRGKSAVTFGTVTSASASTNVATAGIGAPVTSNRSKQRPFRSIVNNGKTSGVTRQWVTREIAALEFLQMGIPMAREGSIVNEGWMRQQQPSDQYQDRPHVMDQSKESNGVKLREESVGKNEEKEEDDEFLPISPALLPLERSHSSPDPTVAKQGRWWEKWIAGQMASGPNQQRQQQNQSKGVNVSRDSQIEDLEEPNEPQQGEQQLSQSDSATQQQQTQQPTLPSAAATIYAPGRRLEGDVAVKVQIPLANTLQNNRGGPGLGMSSSHKRQRQNSDFVSLQLTKHQSIARMAILREWELRVAHGLNERHNQHNDHPSHHHRQQHHHNPAMLDGRMYMSAKESYPMMTFSLLRYEPKKEEALRRRQKLEERGGGGTQFFIMPSRDWRGISFRALLPVKQHEENLSQKKNTLDGMIHADDEHEMGSLSDKRRNLNNSRLLFDRFATKKTGSKDNFTDANNNEDEEEISIADQYRIEESTKETNDDDDDIDMDIHSDDDEGMGDDTYVAGLLDDPGMVQGRHRNVMIGDRGTGPIVSSTIQFVKPKLLKADLNKQFRERFDGYEPPVSRRKFIGAKVVDGVYTLMDPTKEKGVDDEDGSTSRKNDDDDDTTTEATTVGTVGTPTTGTNSNNTRSHRRRLGSTSSMSLSTVGGSASIDGGTGEGQETIRMPPSLTLSKIRSLKQQALAAAVRAKLEISTVALAIVYFERLCLDCRVDKSNRRLSFAACLLLAIKINEVRSVPIFCFSVFLCFHIFTIADAISHTFLNPKPKGPCWRNHNESCLQSVLIKKIKGISANSIIDSAFEKVFYHVCLSIGVFYTRMEYLSQALVCS